MWTEVLGDCSMRVSTFVPSGKGQFPGVLWLSGLTGTDEVLSQRAANALQAAQELQPLVLHYIHGYVYMLYIVMIVYF